jgi:lipopolysaccharide biosynthesis glycosyltransferase
MTGRRDLVRVVLALYDPSGGYSRHAGVVMTSLFQRASSRVLVTILHDATLTDDNRSRFQKTADTWKQEVCFIDVSQLISKIVSGDEIDRLARHYSRGTLFRLLIPDVVDAAKVLYLDCDTAVNLDIAELWNIDRGERSIGAALDKSMIDWGRKLHHKIRAWAMRYDRRKYFNAGVLLMNLDRVRQRGGLVAEAAQFFKRYHFCCDFVDQDFLNSFFRGDVCFIEERFNNILERCRVERSILHFTKDYRPWAVHLCEPRDYFYWEVFTHSEWRDQIVESMLEMYKNNSYSHLHASDCYKRIQGRLKKDIWTNNALSKLFKDVVICYQELRGRTLERRGRDPT